MARKRVVSRTIPKLTAEVAVANISKGVIENETVELPVACKTEKGALKFAATAIEKDTNKKVVKVVKVEKTDVRYEMPEEDFIKAAKVVPATASADAEPDAE